MIKFKKFFALSLVLVLLTGMMSACGKQGGTSSEDPTKANTEANDNNDTNNDDKGETKKNVTLTSVSMHGGTDPNADNYKAIIDQFVIDNPHVKIEDDSASSTQEWKTKIAADFAVGSEPDVIQYFTDANASDVLKADKFVTVADIKAEYPDYAKDTLDSALKAASAPNGTSYAVPTTGYWEGLFVNKDLFDQYNLELPTDWDKMLTAIETFKDNGITPIAVSLNEVPHYWVEFLLLSAAGPDEYQTVPESAPQSWIDGLNMFKTLRDLGAFPVDVDTISNDEAGNLFKNKNAAMQLDGSWYLGGVTDQDNTIVMSFPVIPGGKAPVDSIVGGISTGFYITKKAWDDPDKRDAAVKLVMAHTNKEAVTKYWAGNGAAACAVDPMDGMSPLAVSGVNFSGAASNICAPTDSRITQEAYNTLIDGIVGVSTGGSAEDLINEVLRVNAK